VSVPRIKSAKKRMRQAAAATARNRTQRSQLRSAIKKVRNAAAGEGAEAFAAAVTLIDRAGRKNIIHRNAAARQKSRLAKALNKAAAAK
jgi:small subunit ribosomal protein S20